MKLLILLGLACPFTNQQIAAMPMAARLEHARRYAHQGISLLIASSIIATAAALAALILNR